MPLQYFYTKIYSSLVTLIARGANIKIWGDSGGKGCVAIKDNFQRIFAPLHNLTSSLLKR